MAADKAFPGRIVFDHLPKAAGQAVNAWLSDALGEGCVTPNLIGGHRDLIRRYGGLYSVISAHIDFHDAEGLDPRYQYITLFREPIDRAISWIFYVLNDAGVTKETLPLKEGAKRFLESDGRDTTPEFLRSICNPYTEHFCRIGGNGADSDDVKEANALAAIQTYDVVGLYGDMPKFLAEVAGLIGLPAPKSIARVNVTSQRQQVNQISPALRERVVALNQLDLRVYAEVVAWKESCINQGIAEVPKFHASQWRKYDQTRDRVVSTTDVAILTAGLREGYNICRGQLMTFDVDIFLSREVADLEMGIHIFDSDRRWAFGINSTLLGQSHQSVRSGSYRASHHLIADLPAGKYTAGFAFAERWPEGARELAWHDALCEFEVFHESDKPFAGYSYLPAQISLSPTRLAMLERVVTDATGGLSVCAPLTSMAAAANAEIEIDIVNRSEQLWLGDVVRPVNLSYHWLNRWEESVIADGLRTPLPTDGIPPGGTVRAKMAVEAPKEAGAYILVLTLVQERVGWFEEKGFEAARLQVEVVVPHA